MRRQTRTYGPANTAIHSPVEALEDFESLFHPKRFRCSRARASPEGITGTGFPQVRETQEVATYGSFNRFLCFPEAVQIAVFPCRYRPCVNAKHGFRSFTGFQELTVCRLSRNNFDPLDVVLLFYGMRDDPNFDFHPGIRLLNDRYVLFFCGIHGVFLPQHHGLTAADQFTFSAMEDFNNISASLDFFPFIT